MKVAALDIAREFSNERAVYFACGDDAKRFSDLPGIAAARCKSRIVG
jgi:hypothetical protein